MEKKHSVLLVGDGDFSFSADFVQKTGHKNHVISSCLLQEGEELSVERKKNSALVIDCGGEVMTNVDATKLHEHPIICQRTIVKIIFNFPHVGGKMKLGENRKLLKNFFISAGRLLKCGNEVQISLCAGQGGTPAEKKPRAWNNTWQITEMAAFGGFILTDVSSFPYEDYPSYRCTGYRSMEKGFHLEGAMVHTFQKNSSAMNTENFGEDFKDMPLLVDLKDPLGNTYKVPRYFALKLSFPIEKCPPVQEMLMHLEKVLNNMFPDITSISPPPMTENVDFLLGDVPVMDSPLSALKSMKMSRLLRLDQNILSTTSEQFCNHQIRSTFQWFRSCCNCPVNNTSLPVCHQVLAGFADLSILLENGKLCQIFEDIIKFIIKDSTITWPKILLRVTENDSNIMKTLSTSSNIRIQLDNDVMKAGFWHRVPISLIFFADDMKTEGNKQHTNLTREVHFADIYQASNLNTVFLSFNVDTLVMYQYNVNDWRHLWSETSMVKEINHQMVYSSRSLYPPTYVHDLSFWVGKEFKEGDIFLLIRNVAGDLVKEVVLIDEYHSSDGLRLSYCYRIVYKSLERPLSRDSCQKIQMHLRAMLASHLKVELR